MAYNKFYQTPYKKAFALALRNTPTETEKLLWAKLQKGQRKNNRFVRQKVIYGWITDFYTNDSRVVIEIDGDTHNEAADKIRDKAMNKGGIYVLRFTNDEIRYDMQNVLLKIDSVLTLKSK